MKYLLAPLLLCSCVSIGAPDRWSVGASRGWSDFDGTGTGLDSLDRDEVALYVGVSGALGQKPEPRPDASWWAYKGQPSPFEKAPDAAPSEPVVDLPAERCGSEVAPPEPIERHTSLVWWAVMWILVGVGIGVMLLSALWVKKR